MSLATRCSNCATVFRVVQDQLKVSEGWVRCGRCSSVFNALEGLLDLGRDLPPRSSDDDAPIAHDAPVSSAAAATPSEFEPAGTDLPAEAPVEADVGAPSSLDDLRADRIDAHLFRNRRPEKTPQVQVVERDRLEFSDARFDSDLFADDPTPAETEQIELHSTGVGDLQLEHTKTPDFLRRAERRARWRSNPIRVALGGAGVLAAALLLLQATHHFRDSIAAHWPAARPAILAWCQVIGCTLQAPRRIDELTVESTALTRAVGRDAFVLSVNLRSRSAIAVALPSVDLSLTDGDGRLVARRALSPRDFHAAAVLPAGGDAALQLTLAAGNARVAGYTVELFYP